MNFLVVSIPFLQLGFSWWVTVSLGCAIWLLFRVVIIRKVKSPIMDSILLCTLGGMMISIVVTPQAGSHDIVRVLREGLILMLLLQILSGTSKIQSKTEKFLPWSITFTSIIELLYSGIQFVGLQRGSFISLPFYLYGERGGVLPTVQDIRYSPIRPTGTFTEPSYLGMVSVGLIICTLAVIHDKKIRTIILSVNLLTILISQSKLGYFGLFMILVIMSLRKTEVQKSKIKVYLVSAGLGILSAFLIRELGDQASDSFSSRFSIPLKILPEFLLTNPFGFPFHLHSSLLLESNPSIKWEDVLHNSIYNLAFSYGLIFIPILFLLFWSIHKDSILLAFFLIAMIQNGTFFDFDKFVLVSTVYLLRSRTYNRSRYA